MSGARDSHAHNPSPPPSPRSTGEREFAQISDVPFFLLSLFSFLFSFLVPFFLPYYNDGSPIEARKLQRLQARLLERFGGLTFFPQPNEGYWTLSGITYRDEIVIYRVLTDKAPSARRFLAQLKGELKRELQQQEILIVEHDVKTL